MINGLFEQPGYQTAKKMLDVTVLRHEAIASNLANIETPNYKRIDVNPSFQEALKQAVRSGDSSRIEGLHVQLEEDQTAKATNRDGNTVQLEKEMMALNQNTMAHTLETQMLTGSLLKMRLAITGRPS